MTVFATHLRIRITLPMNILIASNELASPWGGTLLVLKTNTFHAGDEHFSTGDEHFSTGDERVENVRSSIS